MKRVAPPAFLLALVSFLVISTAPARLQQPAPRQPQEGIASTYEVSDVMIPARDGATPEALPIIFKRTPYGIEGSAGNFNA